MSFFEVLRRAGVRVESDENGPLFTLAPGVLSALTPLEAVLCAVVAFEENGDASGAACLKMIARLAATLDDPAVHRAASDAPYLLWPDHATTTGDACGRILADAGVELLEPAAILLHSLGLRVSDRGAAAGGRDAGALPADAGPIPAIDPRLALLAAIQAARHAPKPGLAAALYCVHLAHRHGGFERLAALLTSAAEGEPLVC